MSNHQTFARLENLEVRLYQLVTKSHLRIGAGEGTADISAAENPIIRALTYHENEIARVPYLPGSSLHGVIRAWVEKALRSREHPVEAEELRLLLEENLGLLDSIRKEVGDFLGKDAPEIDDILAHWQVHTNVCDPLLRTDQCERIMQRDRPQRDWKLEYWQAIGRPMPCDVCSIFGYAGQRGRIKVSNAFPSSPPGEKVPIDVITRVAINRLTGAADEGKLFDLEAIPPGVTFYFFVVMENMTDSQKEHFDKGIKALSLQLAGLGAHSTVGFGMVDVERLYTAVIEPAIFEVSLEEELPKLFKDSRYRLQTLPLDQNKYPDFFLALTGAWEQQAESPFAGHIMYR